MMVPSILVMYFQCTSDWKLEGEACVQLERCVQMEQFDEQKLVTLNVCNFPGLPRFL